MKLLTLFMIISTLVSTVNPLRADDSPIEPITSQQLEKQLKPHPRIILTDHRLEELKKKIATDPVSKELAGELRRLADELVAGKEFEGWRPPQWKLASTGAVPRISTLALMYRLHGKKKYLQEAERSLRQLAQEIINPQAGVEYLKRAAVLMALGIGFDWLHDDLSADTLDLIEHGIVEGGAADLLQRNKYKIPNNNWTTVSYGGTAVAMLAIAERTPELAAKAVNQAIRLLPTITAQYLPDGISFEGAHYWDFPMMYHVMATDALRTGLGNDHGLAAAPGLRPSFTWRIVARGPLGDDFHFGDGERVNRAVQSLSWAASEYDQPYMVNPADVRRMMRKPERFKEKTWMVFPLIWLPADAKSQTPPKELLAFQGGGPSANVLFRSAWNDPNATWLAIKGGRANVSHAHMDVGSFILEAGGVRWFEETSTHHYFSEPFTKYKIEDIWSYNNPNSDRWKVYAWNNHGHNTLTIADALHDPNATGSFSKFVNKPGQYSVRIDLTKVLGNAVDSATRYFRMNSSQVMVEDRWTAGDKPVTMIARLHTSAQVEKVSDHQLRLTRNSKTLLMDIVSLHDIEIVVVPVETYMNLWDRRLEGMNVIDLRVRTTAGTKDGWTMTMRVASIPNEPRP